ncbi:uridine kinase [Aurantimicrobium minutum]|nr:uridine kinase [Aurantimicrobium minutum]
MLSPDFEHIISHMHDTASAYLEAVKLVPGAPAPTFLIDGPSGSGKTTLARQIELRWNTEEKLQVVHMDDLYPGWDGLGRGSMQALRMLQERSRGEDTRWQRYDWESDSMSEWHSVEARVPLLIEGCGSSPKGAEELSQVRLWLDAPAAIRKERALSRTEENFAEHWTQWDEQFAEYCVVHNPQAVATRVVLSSE